MATCSPVFAFVRMMSLAALGFVLGVYSSRVARIKASMWSRYHTSRRRPPAVKRYSVLGMRPEKDFVH